MRSEKKTKKEEELRRNFSYIVKCLDRMHDLTHSEKAAAVTKSLDDAELLVAKLESMLSTPHRSDARGKWKLVADYAHAPDDLVQKRRMKILDRENKCGYRINPNHTASASPAAAPCQACRLMSGARHRVVSPEG